LPKPLVQLTIAGAAALTAYNTVAVVRTRRRRRSEALETAAVETTDDATATNGSTTVRADA
jgi:hypothetical protein